LYVEIFFQLPKERGETFYGSACLIDIFYLENAIFLKLVLTAILRAIRGENRLQNRIE
jgi:hypothetical protein